jgi:DNA-binding response OmpR family regulator
VPPEPSHPRVLVVSDDALLRELVAELLTQERFEVFEAGDVGAARTLVLAHGPAVVLIDAIVDAHLAEPILEDPAVALGDAQAALVVISGAGTPASVGVHPLVDRVLTQPLTADVLVSTVRHCASWQSSRQLESGTRLRPELHASYRKTGE